MAKDVSYPDLFPPLEGTKVTTVLDDVPGCACQGWWCKEEERTHSFYSDEEMDHVTMCPFLGSAYGFFDLLSSEPICDALVASDGFRSKAGDLGNPDDDFMIGSYYNAGNTLIRVESGNCNAAYQRQQDCFMEPSNYYSTARWHSAYPMNCVYFGGFRLPTTNSTLAVAPACLSSFQAVDSPHDDRWFLYASWVKDDDDIDGIDFCRKDIPRMGRSPLTGRPVNEEARTAGLLQNRSSYPYFPIMGREDWIEPIEGRRYMGYDFVDDQEEANEYCLTVIHLGYEACNGFPEEASSSSTVNSSPTSFVAVLLVFGVVGLVLSI